MPLQRVNIILLLVLSLITAVSAARAQEEAAKDPAVPEAASKEVVPPEVAILKNIEKEMRRKSMDGAKYVQGTIPSLVFTPGQYTLLRDARDGFVTKAPTIDEANYSSGSNLPANALAVSRFVGLGGIAYIGPDDWTIWLNNSRVTPSDLPQSIIDIHVFKEFIELKWYDTVTKQVYPIRLRPNQKFNLDTNIFLPG